MTHKIMKIPKRTDTAAFQDVQQLLQQHAVEHPPHLQPANNHPINPYYEDSEIVAATVGVAPTTVACVARHCLQRGDRNNLLNTIMGRIAPHIHWCSNNHTEK